MSARVKLKRDPIWSNFEVEKFWNVLEPYIRQLLRCEIPTLLDDFQFFEEELNDKNYDKRIFYQNIHDNMWHGRYSSAVANLKALKKFSPLADDNENSHLQELREIFLRRPLIK